MNIKKERKKKKDTLEQTLDASMKSLDKMYVLLENLIDEFKDINENDDIVMTHNVMMEMAEEMGKDHIDFMGMA